MPFLSQAQRRFMYAKHPEIAKRWTAEYPHQGKLPQHGGVGAKEKVAQALMNKAHGH